VGFVALISDADCALLSKFRSQTASSVEDSL